MAIEVVLSLDLSSFSRTASTATRLMPPVNWS